MPWQYIKREAEKTILRLSQLYPVVTVTGPRQSGKTTLARTVFKNKKYVSLEDPDQLDFAVKDPKGFLTQEKTGLLIDEIQNAPELFSYMQRLVDERQKPGHFIITGSRQFGLLSGISQSLAGRSGLLELLPFSLTEVKRSLGDLNQTLYRALPSSLQQKLCASYMA